MNQVYGMDRKFIDRIIVQSLEEDIGLGDVTTDAVIAPDMKARAEWIAKEEGVICGLDMALAVFQRLDQQINWVPDKKDGDKVSFGERIVEFSGQCRAILTAERTALNFAQRMSGIATQTHLAVQLLSGCKTQIVDTRKTVPGLRVLDKYAVNSGGGKNHRMGLYDMAMVKDNHIVAAGGITEAVQMIRKKSSGVKIEVETTTLEQVEEALSAGADFIMLDNMGFEMMESAVQMVDGKALTEASGNLNIKNIQNVAETGVDYISSGALTHSVKAFDISQRIIEIYH